MRILKAIGYFILHPIDTAKAIIAFAEWARHGD